MKTYPNGVMQNYATPNMPPQLQPVHQNNWRMFAPLEDAQVGLEMIQSAVPNAQMEDATTGQYGQFVYFDPNSDVRVRIAYGTAQQDGYNLAIQEYPSDIFDRYEQPQPFVDYYSYGQPHVLAVGVATPVLGQLYWVAR